MIDDDDVTAFSFFVLLLEPKGWFGLILLCLCLAGLFGLQYAACENKEWCARQECPEGQRPVLTENDCYCLGQINQKAE